jgi:hypothetical protein
MATYFWVGGTGTWDGSNFTNWSATSGGAGGAGVPTIADTVTFNASSGTGTVTVASGATCLTLTASAITANTVFADDGFGTAVILSTNATLAAAATGSLRLNFQGTVATSVLNNSSTTVLTQVENNKTSGTLSIATNNCRCGSFSQNTATTTLTTTLTCDYFYLNGGTFNINASTLTATYTISDNGSATTRALVFTTGTANLGTTITTTNLDQITWSFNSTGMTLTRGTGKVVIGSTTAQATFATFTGGGLTYYDVLFQGTKTYITDSNTYTGATTFGFRVTTPASINHELVVDSTAIQTVTAGTFSVVGNSVTNRAYVFSNIIGTAVSIVLTGTGTRTLTNVDLQDIAFTFGSALTGTSIGNCGNISGIIATIGVTCYAKTGATAFNYSGAMWFATSGGSTTQRVPLPQDTVIFDSNTGSGVVTVNVKTLGKNVTTTGWAGSFAYSGSNPSNTVASIYGQYTGTASLLNNISALRFASRTNISIPATSPNTYMVIDTIGATATMSGPISNSNLTLHVHAGTFDTAGYDLTVSGLRITTGDIFYGYIGVYIGSSITANLNASTININYVADTASFTVGTVTFNAGTSTINLVPSGSNAGLLFSSTGKTFNNVTFTPNSSSTGLTISGANTFASFTCSTDYRISLTLPSSTTNTFTNLSLTGKKTATIYVKPSTLSTTATLAIGSNTVTRYTSFRNITKSGASTLTARNVANLGANTGITFAVKTKTLAFTTGASSFTVPGDFAGSSMFYAIGAGGGAAKRTANLGGGGGGSGAIGISSNLNISKGQTVYYSIGSAGVGATASNTSGTNGGQTWVNTSANSAPATANIGASANGGSGSAASTSNGPSGGASNGTVNLVSISGGGGGDSGGGQGGGGGAPAGFNYVVNRAGANGSNSTGGGGGGGAGIAAVGGAPVTGASGRGGNGGAGTGSGGAGGAKGTTTSTAGGAGGAGAGGGGSGSVSSNGATAGAGGAGGAGNEFTYTSLNGTVSTGTIGAGGAGGGGGGSELTTQTTVTGGAGGAGAYGGGGGGSGRGSTVNGNGGNGGGGLLIFVYETTAGNFGGVIG